MSVSRCNQDVVKEIWMPVGPVAHSSATNSESSVSLSAFQVGSWSSFIHRFLFSGSTQLSLEQIKSRYSHFCF